MMTPFRAIGVLALMCLSPGLRGEGELLKYERLGPPPGVSYYGTLAVDPGDAGRLYFASRGATTNGKGINSGMFTTTDGGGEWTYHAEVAPSVNYGNVGIRVHPKNSEVVVAVCEYQPNFWISRDRGVSWEGKNAPYKHGISIALDPRDPQVIYVGSDDGVWKTEDQGGSWKSLRSGLPKFMKTVSNTATDLLIDPKNPDTVYVGFLYAALDEPWGVYKSEDGGASWSACNEGLPTDSLELDLSKAVMKKGDGTEVKGKMATPKILKLQHRAIDCLAMDPVNPRIIYANTRQKGLFRTMNGGESWEQVAEPRFEQDYSELGAKVMGLMVHPDRPELLVAGTDRLTVFVSRDRGESWQCAGRLFDVEESGGQKTFHLPNGQRVVAESIDKVKKGVSWRLFTPMLEPGTKDSFLISSDLGLFRVKMPGLLQE